MFINDNNYITQDLGIVNSIRPLIFKHIYNDEKCLNTLINIIPNYIECLNVDYDRSFYTITIKIKKTGLRKTYGKNFYHHPDFYYQFIPDIFMDFLVNDINVRTKLISALSEVYPSPYDRLNDLIRCKQLFVNLCQVLCLSDNIVVIKL